jgi:hypothetical protein
MLLHFTETVNVQVCACEVLILSSLLELGEVFSPKISICEARPRRIIKRMDGA